MHSSGGSNYIRVRDKDIHIFLKGKTKQNSHTKKESYRIRVWRTSHRYNIVIIINKLYSLPKACCTFFVKSPWNSQIDTAMTIQYEMRMVCWSVGWAVAIAATSFDIHKVSIACADIIVPRFPFKSVCTKNETLCTSTSGRWGGAIERNKRVYRMRSVNFAFTTKCLSKSN